MEHCGTVILQTERLILRPFCREDAELMFRNWASDPKVTEFLTWPTHSSRQVTERVLGDWCAEADQPQVYRWAIVLKEIGEPIGSIGANRVNEEVNSVEIGYCIGSAWWGRGITSEALGAVIDFFFDRVGVNCVCACHDPRNPSSGAVLRKNGMTYEGTWRAGGRNNRGVCDEAWYSILREEYEKRKAGETSPAKREPQLRIRIARPEDAEVLLQIYGPYVENTAVTFEYTVPSPEEFRDRIRRVLTRYPYLAAERDGEVIGYAYAGPFHTRAAYGWAAETSIYIRQDSRGQGIGRSLYEALEKTLRLQHLLSVNACISSVEEDDEYLTRDSRRFHERLGYQLVGEFHRCGYKFGRWYNMIWMEKSLAPRPEKPLPVRPFDEVRQELRDRYGIE